MSDSAASDVRSSPAAAAVADGDGGKDVVVTPAAPTDGSDTEPPLFTLKRWNALAMWCWDVECDTCAICRAQVMDACYRCQAEATASGQDECVVVWGECNHSFHNCCMAKWLQRNNRCPLCQRDWSFQRIGK